MHDTNNISEGLKNADPELYEHLKDCFDRFEIRGSEEIFLMDWFGKALVTESILGLMRQKMVNVVGIRGNEFNEIEPMFQQNTEDENLEEITEE